MRSGKSKIRSLAVFSVSLAGMRVGRGELHEASSLGSTREGRASVIMAISFCIWGNCFILLVHSGRHPNGSEQLMSH